MVDFLKLPQLFGGLSFSSKNNNKENEILVIVGDCFVEITTPNLNYMDQLVMFECIKDFQDKQNSWNVFKDKEIVKDSTTEFFIQNKDKLTELFNTKKDLKKIELGRALSKDEDSEIFEVVKREMLLKYTVYVGESLDEIYTKEFNVMEMLRKAGLVSSSSQRVSILDSIKRLSSVSINWYVPSQKMIAEMNKIRQNRLFFEYQPLLFQLLKENETEFDVHLRKFIHTVSLTDHHNKVKIGVNKGFLDLANKGKDINYIQFKSLGSKMSRNLLVRLTLQKKTKLHEETLYEMLLMKKDSATRSKKANLKIVLNDLKGIGFIDHFIFEDNFVKLIYPPTDKKEV